VGEHYYPARANRAGICFTGLLIILPLIASIAFLGISQLFPAVILIGTLLVVVSVYASAFRLRYELDDKELRFRQGVFSSWRISLPAITRVFPIRGQAGISLEKADCLLIEAGKQVRMVAAPDLDTFLKELAVRAPHLRHYGAELRGAPSDTNLIA
jgi:hypothetical protein